jgi:hypothetical protein
VHIASAYSVALVAVYCGDDVLFEQWRPLNNAPTFVIRSSVKGDVRSVNFENLEKSLNRAISELKPQHNRNLRKRADSQF